MLDGVFTTQGGFLVSALSKQSDGSWLFYEVVSALPANVSCSGSQNPWAVGNHVYSIVDAARGLYAQASYTVVAS
jgi:hypothetical protein